MDEIRFKFLSDSVLKAFEKDGLAIWDLRFSICDWPLHFRFAILDFRFDEA